MTVATTEDLRKQINDKKADIKQWIDEIVPLTVYMRQSFLNNEWKQLEQVSDLVRSDLVFIRLAAEVIQANQNVLALPLDNRPVCARCAEHFGPKLQSEGDPDVCLPCLEK